MSKPLEFKTNSQGNPEFNEHWESDGYEVKRKYEIAPGAVVLFRSVQATREDPEVHLMVLQKPRAIELAKEILRYYGVTENA